MEASERPVAIERMVWGSGCPMVALRETQRLAAQARDPVTVDFQLPPLTSNMAAAAYPSSCDSLCVYHHMQQVTFGASTSALPPYNPIEVINYFVTVEHENELARYKYTNIFCHVYSIVTSCTQAEGRDAPTPSPT